MRIVLAHVGWPWHLEAVAMALHKSNVYLDISGWKYRYLPEEVRREIPRRLRGQFCFGTDYPMFDPEACLAELDRLELPPDVANAVLRDNAAALLGPVAERASRSAAATTGPRPASISADCAPRTATRSRRRRARRARPCCARRCRRRTRGRGRSAGTRCWISVRSRTFLTPWPIPPTKKPAITNQQDGPQRGGGHPGALHASAASAATASGALIRGATPMAPTTIPAIHAAKTSA